MQLAVVVSIIDHSLLVCNLWRSKPCNEGECKYHCTEPSEQETNQNNLHGQRMEATDVSV